MNESNLNSSGSSLDSPIRKMSQKKTSISPSKHRVSISSIVLNSRKARSDIVKNLDFMKAQDLKELSLEILKMDSWDRQKEELMVLRKSTNKIEFFRSMLDKQEEDTLQLCLKHMSLEFHRQHTILFEKGDQAHKFYIIMDGQVGVYVRDNSKEEKKEEEKAPKKGKSKVQQSLDKPGQVGNFFTFDDQDLALRAALLQQQIAGLLKVNQMQAGLSFGELALINDAPRLATIVCELDCNFGVLTKSDYKSILLHAERKKIQKKVQELSENPGFQNLSRRLLNILLYAFKPIKFSFRQYVYKTGDKSTMQQSTSMRNDAIYIVQTGDFQVIGLTNLKVDEGSSPNKLYEAVRHHSSVMERQSMARAPTNLAILTKGQIFGEDEAFKPQARKYSVQCISEQGSVLSISLQELIQRVQVTNETNLINFISQISHEKSLWRKFFHEQSQEVLQGYKNLVSNACSIPNHINRELAKLRRSEQYETKLDKVAKY